MKNSSIHCAYLKHASTIFNALHHSCDVQAPEDVLVLSNMPAAYSLNIDNGLRRTGFPPTPAMSTYLLAIAAGRMVGTSTQVW